MGRMRRLMRVTTVLTGSFAAGLAATGSVPAAAPDAALLAERVLAATVGIACGHDEASYRGTGTVISPDGLILTASSVVPPHAADIRVTLPGFATRPARIVATDPVLTTVLIQVDGRDMPALSVAGELPALGTVVYTAADVDRVLVTNGRASVSRGRVSGIYDIVPRGESRYRGRVIETTAAVNQGSDGGPLVDARGRLCGVISAGVSPLRWQGVAVPTAAVRERWAAVVPVGVSLPPADDGAAAEPDAVTVGLQRAAAATSRHLVGIEVVRTRPVEELPHVSWPAHRGTITDWATLPADARRRRFQSFVERSRVLEVNQLLRRPAGQVTGIVVSADGDILTSLFNVGADTAFVTKRTGAPREFGADEDLERLLREPEGGLERQSNPPVSFTVVLGDGSRHTALLRARHEPLGVALLKIDADGSDADGLEWFDVAGSATSPQLGDPVAVLGWTGAMGSVPTLNAGVVSAAARNRGLQFQTDALLNYGNSGGPVVDAAGNFLGLAAAPLEPDTVQGRLFSPAELMRWTRAPNSGVGLVARADRIRDVLPDLVAGRSFERIPGPYLGVVADASRAFGEDVFVGAVAAGSPAESAGVKKGDRIVEFNGAELRDWRDLTERIAAATAGDTVTLTIERRSRGARLVIAGRDVETVADLERLKRSLEPGETFTGELTTDDTRRIDVVLGENR